MEVVRPAGCIDSVYGFGLYPVGSVGLVILDTYEYNGERVRHNKLLILYEITGDMLSKLT